MEKRQEVIDAMVNFVIYVSDSKNERMPEEVEALPAILELLFRPDC